MSCCARQIRASNEILSCGHLTGDEDGIMTTVSGSASAASSAAAAAPPGTMTQLIGTLHEYKPEVEPFTVYMERATVFLLRTTSQNLKRYHCCLTVYGVLYTACCAVW